MQPPIFSFVLCKSPTKLITNNILPLFAFYFQNPFMLKSFSLQILFLLLFNLSALPQQHIKGDFQNFQSLLLEGDILFQETYGDFSEAIKLATKSNISHCGLLLKKNNEWYVFEAYEPVLYTPLKKWVSRSNTLIVKRLNENQKIESDVVSKMNSIAKTMNGKHYDSKFLWTDTELYCSELVWKIYKGACNVQLGTLQRLSDFDLTSPLVKKQMQINYGNNIPMNETIISPISILNDKKLITVYSTN